MRIRRYFPYSVDYDVVQNFRSLGVRLKECARRDLECAFAKCLFDIFLPVDVLSMERTVMRDGIKINGDASAASICKKSSIGTHLNGMIRRRKRQSFIFLKVYRCDTYPTIIISILLVSFLFSSTLFHTRCWRWCCGHTNISSIIIIPMTVGKISFRRWDSTLSQHFDQTCLLILKRKCIIIRPIIPRTCPSSCRRMYNNQHTFAGAQRAAYCNRPPYTTMYLESVVNRRVKKSKTKSE